MIDIFYELINEAKEGKVIIDGECWPIGFNTLIPEDNIRLGFEVEDYIEENLDTLSEEEIGSLQRNLSCLRINNKQVFFALLEDYINKELEVGRKSLKIYGPNKEKDTIKCLMAYLFVNATTEDFLNPCAFLIRRIKFLEDNTLGLFEDGQVLDLGPLFKGSKLFIKDSSQSVMMETHRKLELSFVREDLEYKLPEISYGICEEMGKKVCYIYSFLDKQKKEFNDKREEKYFKEIKRLFYKVNANVIDDSEEENIKDVSPSSVISLMVFATLIRKYDIVDIRAVPYLPLRYLSRDINARNARVDRKEELFNRNDQIQYNITNKFIRTFNRVAYHLDGFDIISFPYELDENLHVLNSGEEVKVDNELLEDVTSFIK